MSRRVAAPADRAAQNQQTIKALLKLEGNKICADCKRNKHPRWASWNLGVFVCIRCSGIHRGMGTHISRVKSVDLDSWTDEQLQSVLRWGNSRANKYWEAKLARGHMPSEAKIENFIRTKYESKRWVMDGPMPDPATLDADGDDDVPLNIVQEKAKIERSASQRIASAPQQPPPPRQPAPSIDLFGDEPLVPPVRPSTTDIPSSKPVTRTSAVPATTRTTKPGDSLLGLDFFGNSQSNDRPSSAGSNQLNSTNNSRPDLKQSILSLYASAPKQAPAPAPANAPHNRQPSFGGLSSPPPNQQDSFGGLADAFSGLSFPSSNSTKPPPPQPAQIDFSIGGGFGSSIPSKSKPSVPQVTSPPPLSGGSFFDSAPSKPPAQSKAPMGPARAPSNGLNFAFTKPSVTTTKPAAPAVSNDLFAAEEFSGFASASPLSPGAPPVPPPTTVSSPMPPPTNNISSAFNLSSNPTSAPAPQPTSAVRKPPPMVSQTSSAMFDPWSSANDNTWGTPDSAPAKPKAPSIDIGKPPSRITPNDISGGWGAPISSAKNPPTITADEDFGGWTSASATQTPATGLSKTSGGFSSASDPFDNPWG
jgi:stromal membrane-associated protein